MTGKFLFWIDALYTQFGIAKFLQEQLDSEFFAIYDLNHHLKPIFQKQQIVDFNKTWFYWEHSVKTSELIDVQYLKSFEQKYNIKLWNLIYSERLFSDFNKFHKFTHDELVAILVKDCKFFEMILDEIKPDFLIIKLPDSHKTHLLTELCKKRGIKVMMLVQSRLGYRVSITDSISQLNYNNKILEDVDGQKNFDELKKYYEKFSKLKQFSEMNVGGMGISVFKKIATFLNWAFKSYDQEYLKTYDHYGISRIKVLKNQLFLDIAARIRKRFLDRHAIKEIKDHNFIYFPLHIQPERNLDIDAPFYTNQLDVIKSISKSIPVNFTLYVKEHFNMIFRNWRPILFYKEILSLPNVKLIHPSVNPIDIIKKTSLVINIAGSTGLEAAIYSKPSIVFADVSYQNLSCVERLENIADLPEMIINSLEKSVNPTEVYQFLKLLEEDSIEFDEIQLNNELIAKFHSSGLVPSINISISDLDLFFEKRRVQFEPLISRHLDIIKK